MARVVYGRASVYALKIAMLEQVSAVFAVPEPDAAVKTLEYIDDIIMENAIYFVESVEKENIDRYRLLASDNSYRNKEDLYNVIASHGRGGISHHDLLRSTRLKRVVFNDLIETLREERRVFDISNGLKDEPVYAAKTDE